MYRTDFWTLWEKVRVGCSEKLALKQVYYQGWNRSPAQVGCMRQVLGAGALGRPRGMGWRGRWEGRSGWRGRWEGRSGWRGRREGRSGWRIHVNPWLIHVSVWQKPLQYCKVFSLQLIKINEKKKKRKKIERYQTKKEKKIIHMGDFPGGPVVKTLCFQCRWPRFDLRSRNKDPTCWEA